MPTSSLKPVDGLSRKEKAPEFGPTQGEGLELAPEIKPEITESVKETLPVEQAPGIPAAVVAAPSAPPAPPVVKTPAQQQIENILAEDLDKIYADLPAAIQLEFKVKGEQTASKITLLLQKTKIKISEIIKLIKEWLKTIPGINQFFLEQEAKIKADKIVDLRRPR